MKNYEKAYKEALKVMESLYNVVKYRSSSDALLTTQTIEKAFPELRESEDEMIRKAILELVRQSSEILAKKNQEQMIAWLEKQGENKELKKIEQKPAWSEEDEKLYNSSLWHIKNSCGNGGKDSGEYEVYNWLKSIKDRVQPKPKQEWSEEDERMIDSISKTIGFYMSHIRTQCEILTNKDRNRILQRCKTEREWIERLKSLKPHWKPSEEQMNGLKFFLDYHRSQRNAGTSNWREYDAIESLFNDLQKL